MILLADMRAQGRAEAAASDSGAAAVEFAVVAPLIVLVMISILYFGIYISVSHSVQQLAADGARASVAGLGDAERETLTVDYINTEAPKYFLIDGERIEVDVVPGANEALTVTVSYDASPLLGWYPVSFGALMNSTIQRTAAVRAGGF
jgi:Flp pilus assembly protein TadG